MARLPKITGVDQVAAKDRQFAESIAASRGDIAGPFTALLHSPELAARVRKQRVERLPLLKTGMREMMRNMAAAFTQIPAGQQMVLVVRLWYGPWEDTTGMPAQVVMRADRASAAAGKVETEER